MSKAVIFGPWVGEFSYEISWWIPEIRKIRLEQVSDHYVFHVGYSGRKALYKDFIDEYIPYPKDLQTNLGYPSMTFILENGRHVFPESVKKYFRSIINQVNKKYEKVLLVNPNAEMINKRMQETPTGVFRSLVPEKKHIEKIKKKMNKMPKSRETIAINVYARKRLGPTMDGPEKTWDPVSWQQLIIKCIEDLKLNIILFGVPQRDLYPGSLNLEQLKLLKKYDKYILDLVSETDESLEIQAAILKSTKCSFWGATGAVVLAFLTNTPVFAHQAKEYGYRLNFEWERALTDNHKHVRNFDKYTVAQMWSSPVEDVFNEFKKFLSIL